MVPHAPTDEPETAPTLADQLPLRDALEGPDRGHRPAGGEDAD
jgi:hypothetical protein